MLTGTPLDLTPFGPLLSLLGIAYWLVAFALVAVALWLPRSWHVKGPLAVLRRRPFARTGCASGRWRETDGGLIASGGRS